MELESLTNFYLVIALLMPGFIYRAVLTQFVPLRQQAGQENILLAYLTGTAFMYVICSPLIVWLMSLYSLTSFVAAPVRAMWILFGILFVLPAILGITMAFFVQYGWLARACRHFIKLKIIHPIPTGWDWKFATTGPSFVLVTLVDGKTIAGWFGEASMASSDPDRRDLFLEKVYVIPSDDSPWIETPGSSGVYIDGEQIASIEFRGGSQ